MESSKIHAYLFLCMLFLSSAAPILGCGTCGKPVPKKHKPSKKPGKPVKPPGIVPPIVKPPGIVPPIVKPPVILPPVTVPPVTVPPITVPPVVKPTLPPIPGVTPILPPVPVLNPPSTPTPTTPGSGSCPPPKSPPGGGGGSQATCPIDTLKLGSCVDLLGGLIHIGLGDPAVNKCCPVLQGLVEVEAAACLCTTLKLKLLNLNIYVPLALQLLVACGKTPPPGTPAPSKPVIRLMDSRIYGPNRHERMSIEPSHSLFFFFSSFDWN
ncbi:LOW QUALITY PROTEIN: 36.4 kDa proline-rich protein [Lotus japonicus]|uniref:LOW QUALITY PROTEIN: 36.4 kDa proline-rich protein n=1 Tax=Lotus japonicus TaxID=34305 RepID=UPI00258E1AD1|nr:LOW QUALITY PROTEIN: 36.4 kDa proline-rich protein [Lotus japonicus]